MTMYAIPSMLDTYTQEVKVVDGATHYRKWDRDRDREKEERKKKNKNQCKTLLFLMMRYASETIAITKMNA